MNRFISLCSESIFEVNNTKSCQFSCNSIPLHFSYIFSYNFLFYSCSRCRNRMTNVISQMPWIIHGMPLEREKEVGTTTSNFGGSTYTTLARYNNTSRKLDLISSDIALFFTSLNLKFVSQMKLHKKVTDNLCNLHVHSITSEFVMESNEFV